MPFGRQDLVYIAGIAAGSMITGGVIGYVLAGGKLCYSTPTVQPQKQINSSYPLYGHRVDEKTSKTAVETMYTTLFNRDPVDDYVVANTLSEPDILCELREFTMTTNEKAVMLTNPVQVQLHRMILKMIDAKKCLEIGVFTGYNVLSTALTIPPEGKIYGLDVNEEWVNQGRPFFARAGVNEKIDIKITPASAGLDDLLANGHSGSFDFIYIDANKDDYDEYYEKSLLLLRKGGIIALDNMLQNGHVVTMKPDLTPQQLKNATVVDNLNKKIHKDERIQCVFLNIADGLNLVRKL